MAIEVCIDIGNHIIASSGYRTPQNYGDVFTVLAEHGHVAPDEVPTLIAMAGFRNLLVHGYADVDDERVVDILRKRLDDLDRFRKNMASLATAEEDGDAATP